MRGEWRARSWWREQRPAAPVVPRGRKTLLTGWFTFGRANATAGDLYVRDLVAGWLREAGHDVEVAGLPPFDGDVDWRHADPAAYDHVVFACGPFHRQPNRMTSLLLKRYGGARWAGLNLTMLEPLTQWNPFDLLWQRDAPGSARPDLTFLVDPVPVPVIGVCLVEEQREHADGLHAQAGAAIAELVAAREVATVAIDTRLDRPQPLRTPDEVRSLIGRMDALVTTRLHGTVLALATGVPPLVIDPIAGGAKVLRQAEHLDWPARFTADALDPAALERALTWCLTDEARARARACADRARAELADLEREVVAALRRSRAECDAKAKAVA